MPTNPSSFDTAYAAIIKKFDEQFPEHHPIDGPQLSEKVYNQRLAGVIKALAKMTDDVKLNATILALHQLVFLRHPKSRTAEDVTGRARCGKRRRRGKTASR